MSKLLQAFTTGKQGSGATYKKKEDSAGRTYYVKEGSGRIQAQQFHGAKAQINRIVTETDDGAVPEAVRDADTQEEMIEATGIPFDQRVMLEFREDNTLASKKREEGNRYIGFVEANRRYYDGYDDVQAMEDYIEFRNKIKEANTAPEAAAIRKQYGLRGS